MASDEAPASASSSSSSSTPRPRVPVIIVTGFLGAGKTTLVNHILRTHAKRDAVFKICVVENEFGDVGVDHLCLAASSRRVHLVGGCACCDGRANLVDALLALLRDANDKEDSRVDAVVIETTGLAAPAPVARALCVAPLSNSYRLASVACVVDAAHFTVPAVELDAQMTFADRVLINKVDLVSERTLNDCETVVRAVNEDALVARCERCRVPDELLSFCQVEGDDHDDSRPLKKRGFFSLSRALRYDPSFLSDSTRCEHSRSASYASVSLRYAGDVDVFMLHSWLREASRPTKSRDLFRVKGVLAVRGENRKYVVQGVRAKVSGRLGDPDLAPWELPQDRSSLQDGEQSSRASCFVFLGRFPHLARDAERLKRGFLAWCPRARPDDLECRTNVLSSDDRVVVGSSKETCNTRTTTSSSSVPGGWSRATPPPPLSYVVPVPTEAGRYPACRPGAALSWDTDDCTTSDENSDASETASARASLSSPCASDDDDDDDDADEAADVHAPLPRPLGSRPMARSGAAGDLQSLGSLPLTRSHGSCPALFKLDGVGV